MAGGAGSSYRDGAPSRCTIYIDGAPSMEMVAWRPGKADSKGMSDSIMSAPNLHNSLGETLARSFSAGTLLG